MRAVPGGTGVPDCCGQAGATLCGSRPPPGEATACPARCDHKASRPDAATTSGTPLNDLAPRFAPQRHRAPDGGRSRARAKEPVREATVGSFPPDWNCPASARQHTSALTWDFAYELNSGPSPCAGRGPRIGRRKTRLTCGAPLRNRTVDLLLTMYRSAVPHPQVDRLTCANTSTRWHSRAPDEPTRASFATQSATHFDLADEPSYEVIDI